MSEDLPATRPEPASAREAARPGARRPTTRQLTRWLRTIAWLGLFGLFVMPWLTVGCLPARFGHEEAGGTTRYNGYRLAFGLDPWRDLDHLVPAGESLPDALGLQPVALLVLVLAAVAVVASIVLPRAPWRRLISLSLAVASIAGIGVAVAIARAQLVALVTSQLGHQPLPEGHVPADYVSLGHGVQACGALLGVIVLAELVMIVLTRIRRSPTRTRPRQGEGRAKISRRESEP